jgi:diacylglycerol kinase family enzyme
MMFREDKKRIPIAFIPNGSGNDTCKAIGVHSIEQALEYIKKGDLLKVDLNRVWIDAETFEEIERQEGDQKFSKIRYSIINAATGFVAKTVHKA